MNHIIKIQSIKEKIFFSFIDCKNICKKFFLLTLFIIEFYIIFNLKKEMEVIQFLII